MVPRRERFCQAQAPLRADEPVAAHRAHRRHSDAPHPGRLPLQQLRPRPLQHRRARRREGRARAPAAHALAPPRGRGRRHDPVRPAGRRPDAAPALRRPPPDPARILVRRQPRHRLPDERCRVAVHGRPRREREREQAAPRGARGHADVAALRRRRQRAPGPGGDPRGAGRAQHLHERDRAARLLRRGRPRRLRHHLARRVHQGLLLVQPRRRDRHLEHPQGGGDDEGADRRRPDARRHQHVEALRQGRQRLARGGGARARAQRPRHRAVAGGGRVARQEARRKRERHRRL
mmetsp:Transcript_47459/g.146418  ORF Transcript_47459/g.146418 Transcript_47459/m.146418 type:complete len:291 (+) Transcript_47459:2004-2876(+)